MVSLTALFQDLREKEYSRLDEQSHVYLDYAGGGLYARSQIVDYFAFLAGALVGNPHSYSPSSLLGASMVEKARREILSFFNANEGEYEVIFTPNATGAIKLVAESYPFQRGSVYALTADNHNSINGVREFARRKKAEVRYIPLDKSLRVTDIEEEIPVPKGSSYNLFAYPAQSNFSGVQHPLDWIGIAHSKGYDVILDAAAYVPTNRLDLGVVKPEFVPISFYKMFGFPTGMGALIVRSSCMGKLSRPWFSGGTIEHVTTRYISHSMVSSVQRFEDGTVDYLGIPAVSIGLKFLQTTGMRRIHQHVISLAGDLQRQLHELKHSNGSPLVRIYGPEEAGLRGGTIAFNIEAPDGSLVDFRLVGVRAMKSNMSIRTGCFCNPGVAEYAFDFSPENERNCLHRLAERLTPELFSECISGSAKGAVRVSLGIASNNADIDRLMDMLLTFRNFSGPETGEDVLPRLSC